MFNPLSTKDPAIQVALRLEGGDLWNLCSTNKQLLGWICNNKHFWTQKIIQDFKINTQETLGRAGASNDYRFLYNIKDKDLGRSNPLFVDESDAGNMDHIKFLLKKGADVHLWYDAALRFAAENGHKDVVKLLLKNGANIHAQKNDAWRLAASNGHKDVVVLLLNNGADIRADNDYALRVAAKNGHRAVVELLLENGANPAFLN